MIRVYGSIFSCGYFMYLDVIGMSKEFFISWAFHVNFPFVVRTKANLKEKMLSLVFIAILTGRQSGQKLQCVHGNPIANSFFQN